MKPYLDTDHNKKKRPKAVQMKLFIQYVDTRVFHLYSARTWAFSYQNKSYQGQVYVSFDSRGFHISHFCFSDSAAMIHLPGSLPSQIWTPCQQLLQSIQSPHYRHTLIQWQRNQPSIMPVHNKSDDTPEWYIHLWPRNHMGRNTNMGKNTHAQRKDFSNKHAGFI